MGIDSGANLSRESCWDTSYKSGAELSILNRTSGTCYSHSNSAFPTSALSNSVGPEDARHMFPDLHLLHKKVEGGTSVLQQCSTGRDKLDDGAHRHLRKL